MKILRIDCNYGLAGNRTRVELDDGTCHKSNCGSYLNRCTCSDCSDIDVWLQCRGCVLPAYRVWPRAPIAKLPPINPPPLAPPSVQAVPYTGAAPPGHWTGTTGFGGGGASAPAPGTPLRMSITPNGIAFDGFSWAGVVGDIKHPEYKPGQLPPQNCKTCNHHNEYAGPEHLIDGVYYCRQCTPKALRQKKLGLLK